MVNQKENPMKLFRREDLDIDPTSASQLVANEGVVFLDVREDDEWEAGHAPGATHMALGQLSAGGLAGGKVVIAVCRSGGRSARATAELQVAGIEVRNLAGGMQAWSAAGLPVCRDDGSAGVVL
jgi:rhodanese-related sulfurtransferase